MMSCCSRCTPCCEASPLLLLKDHDKLFFKVANGRLDEYDDGDDKPTVLILQRTKPLNFCSIRHVRADGNYEAGYFIVLRI